MKFNATKAIAVTPVESKIDHSVEGTFTPDNKWTVINRGSAPVIASLVGFVLTGSRILSSEKSSFGKEAKVAQAIIVGEVVDNFEPTSLIPAEALAEFLATLENKDLAYVPTFQKLPEGEYAQLYFTNISFGVKNNTRQGELQIRVDPKSGTGAPTYKQFDESGKYQILTDYTVTSKVCDEIVNFLLVNHLNPEVAQIIKPVSEGGYTAVYEDPRLQKSEDTSKPAEESKPLVTQLNDRKGKKDKPTGATGNTDTSEGGL